MRRPSLTSVLHWAPMPMLAPPEASCSGAGGALWTTAVSAECYESEWRSQKGQGLGRGSNGSLDHNRAPVVIYEF